MGILSGIGGILDSIFGTGGSSTDETTAIKQAIEADDKRDTYQKYYIAGAYLLGTIALLVAIFKKK